MNYPVTQAIRFLRRKKIEFEPYLFEYVERGGTSHSAESLGIDEHAVIKTLVFETNEKKSLLVLMHGDREVSEKNLARFLNVKSVSPASSDTAQKLTGYVFGGTSPFGLKTNLPIYAEKTIFELDKIFINGGKRGFLVELESRALRAALKIEEVEIGIESKV